MGALLDMQNKTLDIQLKLNSPANALTFFANGLVLEADDENN